MEELALCTETGRWHLCLRGPGCTAATLRGTVCTCKSVCCALEMKESREDEHRAS